MNSLVLPSLNRTFAPKILNIPIIQDHMRWFTSVTKREPGASPGQSRCCKLDYGKALYATGAPMR